MTRVLVPFVAVGFIWAQAPQELGPVGRGVNFYSFEKERALGKALAEEVSKSTHRVDDPEINARVKSIGTRIAEYLPGDYREFEFAVVEESVPDRPSREPIALPGGYIIVSRPLLEAAQDDNELAAMMAHAMAHVAARHGTRQASRGQLMHAGTIPLIFMGGWQGFGGEGPAVPIAFASSARQFEFEADRIAVETLPKAGFDAGALVRYLKRLPETKPTTMGRASAMPSKAERIEALEKLIAH